MVKDYKPKLKEFMQLAGMQNASDLHMGVGKRPTLRIDGNLVPIAKEPILTPEDIEGFIDGKSEGIKEMSKILLGKIKK